MKKILFLSSALIMTVCGAFAEDVAPTPDKKITGGAGTCTVDVLGVSDNNATANTIATWSLNSYECSPGQYLDETTLNCIECPTGSYCPGGTFTVEANNSKTACPTDYTSVAAATAESECYMGCELVCGTNAACPPHSNNCTHSEFKTSGRQYVDATCNAYPSVCPIADLQCDTGYTKITKSSLDIYKFTRTFIGSDIEGTALSCMLNNTDETDGTHYINDSIIPDNFVNDCDFLAPGQVAMISADGALVYQVTINNYNPDTVSGVKSVTYPEESGCDHEGCIMLTEKYLENANFTPGTDGDYVWATLKYDAIVNNYKSEILNKALAEYYASGTLSSATQAILQQNLSDKSMLLLQNLLQNANYVTQDQLKDAFYAAMFSTMDKIETNLPWVSIEGIENTDIKQIPMAGLIAITQAFQMRWNEVAPDAIVSGCAANTINIDWNPDNGGEHTQNMCYYDGAVTLPSDPVRPGYTFMGWKLVDGTTTE